MQSFLAYPALLIVFLVWISANLITLVMSLRGGRAKALMLRAVEKIPAQERPTTDVSTAAGFLFWFSIGWFAAVRAVAGLSLYFALTSSTWALGIFVVVGAWLLYDVGSSPWVRRRMYPGTVKFGDWVCSALGVLVWAYLFVAVLFHAHAP